jgi:hypothetical protein
MKSEHNRRDEDIRKEYDFRGGVRGKYARRARSGSNIVVLDPDVARGFKTSRAVNRALRTLLPSPLRRSAPRKKK